VAKKRQDKREESVAPGADLEHLANNSQGPGHGADRCHLQARQKMQTRAKINGGSGSFQGDTWPTTARVWWYVLAPHENSKMHAPENLINGDVSQICWRAWQPRVTPGGSSSPQAVNCIKEKQVKHGHVAENGDHKNTSVWRRMTSMTYKLACSQAGTPPCHEKKN
jgi:hypothetical protein